MTTIITFLSNISSFFYLLFIVIQSLQNDKNIFFTRLKLKYLLFAEYSSICQQIYDSRYDRQIFLIESKHIFSIFFPIFYLLFNLFSVVIFSWTCIKWTLRAIVNFFKILISLAEWKGSEFKIKEILLINIIRDFSKPVRCLYVTKYIEVFPLNLLMLSQIS